jgi:streptogramin lyase
MRERVWVGAWRTERLAAIDPAANQLIPGLEPASDGGTVELLRVGRTLWVATRARQILQLDAETGEELAPPIAVSLDPSALAVHGSDLYVGQELGDVTPPVIVRIDIRTGEVQTTKVVSPNITGMLYTRGRLWSLHGGPNHIVGRDPQTLQAVRDVNLPGASVGALALGDGALWATIPDQDQLVRYNLRGGGTATVSVGARPIGITVSDHRVWIAASGRSTLERVATRSMRLVGDPIRVPLNPLAVAVSADAVWVTCVGAGVVARVGI